MEKVEMKEGGREGVAVNMTPLPSCRGLLVFMDGEEEGIGNEDGSQQQQQQQRQQQQQEGGGRRRHKIGTEGNSSGERSTHIVGGIMNRRPTSSSSSSTPSSLPSSDPPSSNPLGEAARRVGAFWSNVGDDFANKVRMMLTCPPFLPPSLLPSLCMFFLLLQQWMQA